jgi:hypothetical protein
MNSIFFCLEPCGYYGPSEHGLRVHRGLVPECQRLWEVHLRSAANVNRENAVEHGDENVELDPMDDGQPIVDEGDENPLAGVEGDGMQPYEPNPDVPARDPEEQAVDPGEQRIDPQQEARGRPADANAAHVIEDLYPNAAAVVATAASTFSALYDEQMKTGDGNIYYPFTRRMEWELAQWLHKSGISRARIDEFMKLGYVRNMLSVVLPLLLNTDKKLGYATAALLPNGGCSYGSHRTTAYPWCQMESCGSYSRIRHAP